MNNIEPLKNIRVVLTSTSHPGNIGAAARAMKTMGLTTLALVNPHHFPHSDADARAAGAYELLHQAQVHTNLDSALSGCVLAVAASSRQRAFRHDTMDVHTAARELIAAAAAHPVAIVFGNETSGLSSAEASLCQIWAHIPANPEYPSLNLAAAVQVFGYELRVAAIPSAPAEKVEFAHATLEQVERLTQHLLNSMTQVGFHDPAHPKKLVRRLRRLLARARLEAEEVQLLRGFLKAVERLVR